MKLKERCYRRAIRKMYKEILRKIFKEEDKRRTPKKINKIIRNVKFYSLRRLSISPIEKSEYNLQKITLPDGCFEPIVVNFMKQIAKGLDLDYEQLTDSIQKC